MLLKTHILGFILLWFAAGNVSAQSTPAQNSVIEGGKLVVELIKVLGISNDQKRDSGCKNNHADLCIINQSNGSFIVSLFRHQTEEVREVVVLPGGKECFLQAGEGVWTYDLRSPGSPLSVRKGDLRIEGCHNLEMKIQ